MKDVNTLLNPPFPRSKVFSSLLLESLEGLKRYHLIATAWENGLFEYTTTPKTHQEIAGELGYHELMAQMFCDALVELGLLVRVNNAYTNSQIASSYLSRGSPRCMVSTIQNTKETANRWSQLATVLEKGPITQDKEERFGDKWLISIAEWAALGSVASAMKAVKTQLNPQRWTRLLDLGGGHGLYAIAFSGLNPKLEAFVFDLPKIVPVTRKYVDTYDAERVHVISGDFYKDDIGQDYDAVFSSFNQSCSDPVLIPKLFQALKPGGDLILRRFKDASREGALRILDWNLVHFEGKKLGSKPHSSGDVVSSEVYIEELKAAGFTDISVVSVDDMSEIIFARKPSYSGSEN